MSLFDQLGKIVTTPVAQAVSGTPAETKEEGHPAYMARLEQSKADLCQDNTQEDVDAILQAVPEIVAYLRNMSPLWKDKISGKKEFVL